MDLLRRTVWLRVLTVLLVGLGSTAVAAQPHGPGAEVEAGAASDGTAMAGALSPLVAANAIGVLVDGSERGAVSSLTGAAPSSPVLTARALRATARARWAHPVLIAERPLRHRLCVYRL
jgi:hypothetical protein